MKNPIVIFSTGLVLMIAALVFSNGYSSGVGFLTNLQRMDIVIVKGTYVSYGYVSYGHYEGRIAIPTKFPFMLSLVITVVGGVMLITSRKKD